MHYQDVWLILISHKGLTVVITVWLEIVKAYVKDSPYFKQLKKKLVKDSVYDSHYKEINGLWYYKDRIMLNTSSALCKRVFLEYHSSPSRGHTCHHHTLQRSKHSFWWYGMKIFIKSAVRDCDIRQGSKHENLLTPGLLQPLSIHDKAWKDISMRFIEVLPLV